LCCEATGTCGACCVADDCDDKLPCTLDLCTTTGCAHVPDSSQCSPGETCNPTNGCEASVQCDDPGDCPIGDVCSKPACSGGKCEFSSCEIGQKCCADGCHGCCEAADCNDNLDCTLDSCDAGDCKHTPDDTRCSAGYECRPGDGGCSECSGNEECDDSNPCTTDVCDGSHHCAHGSACTGKSKFCCGDHCAECCNDYDCVPSPLPPTIGNRCASYACDAGKCTQSIQMCTGTNTCCPVGGCTVLGLKCLLDG
jgi:hypothetical protein